MVPTFSILTVIGLGLLLVFSFVQEWQKRNSDERKAKDAKDKEIDAATGADDIMRASGGLRT